MLQPFVSAYGGMQVEEGGSRRELKSREAAQRSELRSRLAGLPQPENEYAFDVPELPEAEEGGEGIEEDAADLAARRKREVAAREAVQLKKRSQVCHSSFTAGSPPLCASSGHMGCRSCR